MKKLFLSILFLNFLLLNNVGANEDSKNINLTCISNDKSMTQTVIISPYKTKELNLQFGFVNGNVVTVDVTDANYILKHEIGPEELPKEEKIQVIHVIDRTTGAKTETWIIPNEGPKFFQGKCQLVKPKF
jgi:hypothetical protein